LGTVVAVTNLRNGRSVLVRINDRGPYVKGRHIDLSHKAASVLGMIGPGTAPVRIDVLRVGSNRSPASKHHRYYVQVGLFNNLAAAKRLQANLLAAYPDVAIDRVKLGHHRYYRVRMGNFTTWDQALARAHQTVNPRFPVVIGRE
jgi:rare lipoprotein A